MVIVINSVIGDWLSGFSMIGYFDCPITANWWLQLYRMFNEK